MRIALCFSGQLRTWRKTMPQFKKFIGILEDKGHMVDVFCHMWNFNTHSKSIAHKLENYSAYEIVEREEVNEILAELNPKSFLLEHEPVSLCTKQTILNVKNNVIKELYGNNNYDHFITSQFYSIMRSAYLKRKYESDNNFVYDTCFRIRYDLLFMDEQLDYFFTKQHEFQQPLGNTIYSVHNSSDAEFPFFKTGDTFWFSNSDSFDRICDFYRWIRLFGKKAFRGGTPCIEVVFFYYLKFINLNFHLLYTDPIIARSSDYYELRQQAGYNGVMNCDKI
mgnify:CR=1 FL=1